MLVLTLLREMAAGKHDVLHHRGGKPGWYREMTTEKQDGTTISKGKQDGTARWRQESKMVPHDGDRKA